mgnify:CR=1 FL=1
MSESITGIVGANSKRMAVLRHAILITGSLFAVFPLIWILSTSLKSSEAVFSNQIEIIPAEPAFINYLTVLSDNNWIFLKWVMNSVAVALGTTIVGIFLASSAAYAFSRFKFPGRKTGLIVFLITQMFPGIILVVPLYEVMKSMGLLNSYLGLIIAYSTTALPFCVFMLKSYFDAIPKSSEEAARIDGLNTWSVFYKIMIPLTLPGIAVTGIFSMITAWNEFMLALTFMNQEDMYMLPVGLQKYVFDFKTEWHLVSAAAILITAPVLVVWLKIQTALLSGKLSGAVKG